MTTTASASRRVLIPPVLPRDLSLGGGAPARELWSFSGETMGTHWRARVVARASDNSAHATSARNLIADAFARVVALMSPWEPTSDLARFAAARAGERVALAPETNIVLRRALDVAGLTRGAFDPTLGAVIDLLGFGPSDRTRRHTADHPAVHAARAAAGFEKLAYDPATRTVLQSGGTRLDLCAIAKGYAVDLASDRLHAMGWTNHFIEIGGEARGRGCKPDGQPWWCGLERPAGSADTVAALCDLAIATSGNTHHFHDHPGGRIGHIVPGNASVAGTFDAIVTVLAPTCMEADVWATALHLLGPTAGLPLAESQHLAACWLLPTNPDAPATEVRTTAFDALLS